MLNRRNFIYQLSVGAAIASVSSPMALFAEEEYTKITILHTNDWHSRIEPFAMDGSRWQGMGGASRRATLIQQIRNEEENVLLFDAGDIFQGTPYFNYYHGELEYTLMNEMGYDAVTIGNHDFDGGLDTLQKQILRAKFKTIQSNYTFENEILQNQILPYTIFKKAGIKIGVLAVGIELKGLVPQKLYGNTSYANPIDKANETAAFLKNEMNCNMVICLSHLGYKYDNDKISDIVLAKKSSNIDLILGGHTHTFLDHPDTILNSVNKEVIVNQVGWAGIFLGKLDFYFTNKKHYLASKNKPVIIN